MHNIPIRKNGIDSNQKKGVQKDDGEVRISGPSGCVLNKSLGVGVTLRRLQSSVNSAGRESKNRKNDSANEDLMHELANKQKQLEKTKKPEGKFDRVLQKKSFHGTLHQRFRNDSLSKSSKD